MRYLEKLLDQFSDTPVNIILHADILRRGIKLNEDLKKAGKNSCQTGLAAKLQKLILEQTDVPPGQFHFKSDETTVDIKVNNNSPYEIKEDDAGRYHLFCEKENFGEVWFTKRPEYTDIKTSSGEECPYLLMQRGSYCLLVSPLDFCAYLKKDEACKYCILSLGMEAGIQRKIVKPIPDPDTIGEAVEIACRKDVKLRDLKLCGGALYNTKKEAKYYKRCLEAILKRIKMPEEITIFSQAMDREDQMMFKDIGATIALFNMEVWDKDMWPIVLPGKSKAIGREEWIRRLETAVEVFGRGHVGSSFVGGFECAPLPGFLTRDEAFKSYISGFEELIKRGIVPWFTIWTVNPIGSGPDDEAPPSTEWYLRLGQELHTLLEKYDMYRDLGFASYGVNPPTLGLYCWYCYSMQFTRDYPRLINRINKKSAQEQKAEMYS